jgi:hypothetical protein
LLPQSSQDQEWSIRPPTLNQDSSATSNMLPHCGQFGRLNLAVAGVRDIGLSYAGWTVIGNSPRRPSPHLSIGHEGASNLWRRRDAIVKLLWLWMKSKGARE